MDVDMTLASTSAGLPIAEAAAVGVVAEAAAPPAPAAAPVPLRRAKVTQDALLAASNKVISVLSDKAMRESFSEIATLFQQEEVFGVEEGKLQFEVLMKRLKELVVESYKAGIPAAWADMCQRYSFIERANELDRIVDKAKLAKKQGEAPRNLYQLGADGQITIPNATVPILRTAAAELKAKRLALAEANAATYARIAQQQTIVARTEGQIHTILEDFVKAMEHLKSVDEKAIAGLQEQLLEAVPVDEA